MKRRTNRIVINIISKLKNIFKSREVVPKSGDLKIRLKMFRAKFSIRSRLAFLKDETFLFIREDSIDNGTNIIHKHFDTGLGRM